MTPEQFDALATLLRLRGHNASMRAARLVMVDGMDKRPAARQCNITPDALYKCLARCARGVELAQVVTGVQPPE